MRHDAALDGDTLLFAPGNPWGITAKDRVRLKAVKGRFRQTARATLAAWDVAPTDVDNILSGKWKGAANEPVSVATLGAVQFALLRVTKKSWIGLVFVIASIVAAYLTAQSKAVGGHLKTVEITVLLLTAAGTAWSWWRDLIK
ncbi:hypothetical protein [Terriglobus tenax]|uniref:hypothetical protein n=1 Tax=Terriglobus tenax TaxID=1111115 RepID=UPI0021DFAABD|nr:hypothetical protein [Terriglobus tenax]